jgi:uncharacterized membrane protein YciS (DUF1049 family)
MFRIEIILALIFLVVIPAIILDILYVKIKTFRRKQKLKKQEDLRKKETAKHVAKYKIKF